MLRRMFIYVVQFAVGFVAGWKVVKMTARSVMAALREDEASNGDR